MSISKRVTYTAGRETVPQHPLYIIYNMEGNFSKYKRAVDNTGEKSGSLGRHDFRGCTFYSPLHPISIKLILISAVLWLIS
jgi:hypothetical protein